MMFYHIENNFYKTKRINDDHNRLVVYHFCRPLKNNKDQIIDLGFLIGGNRQSYNKLLR